MRLRRETGDFQIVVNVVKPGEEEGTYVVNSIRPGLSAEDLIGEVVDMGDVSFAAIVSTSVNLVTNEIIARAVEANGSTFSLMYDPATGSITYTTSQLPSIPVTRGGNLNPTS